MNEKTAMLPAALPMLPQAPPAPPVLESPDASPAVPPLRARPRPWWSVRAEIPAGRTAALVSIGLLLPLAGWALLAASGAVDPVFMPGPPQVLRRLWDWFSEESLPGDIGISTLRVVLGWALSAALALPLGLMIGTFRGAQALLEPLTDFIRYMPAVAFIPLVMVWIGIDESAKVAIIFIGTFFQMVLMVAEDVRRVPMAQIEAAQTMGASRGELIQLVIIPAAKPALLDTLRVTMGWAWTYLVVAELVAASSGLGFSILKAQRFLQTDKIFAGILLIGLIGLAIDQLMRWTHRRAFPYLQARR
ncbi:nitrate transport permease nrtB [Cupriavidus sp. SK-4]|uniref:ABC transporter permease n=1 Tax=Cupriavidus sp. SK-4 TaxID=574750 RepID=UPI00045348BA|nr:ABC transporter permease [Cupriavidus sp. SK-4]EYS94791.1 nitrate transport permease nrtB [Cupriavidus sp. SK-4]